MPEKLTHITVTVHRNGIVTRSKDKGLVGEVGRPRGTKWHWRIPRAHPRYPGEMQRWSAQDFRRQTDAISALLHEVNADAAAGRPA